MTPRHPQRDAHADAAFRALLADLPAAEQQELQQAWHLSAHAQPAPVTDSDVQAATAAFKSALRASENTSPRQDRSPIRNRRAATRWVSLAGALATLTLLVWLAMPITVEAPLGATSEQTLADGSRLVLHPGASVTYQRFLWGRTRHINLEGKAYFDVTESSRPFVVETMNAEVRVLGTAFSVAALPTDTPETTVMLASGSVAFSATAHLNAAVTLRPGEMSRVVGRSDLPTSPQAFEPAYAFLWQDGGFAFIDGPLRTLLEQLSQYYGIAIEAGQALEETQSLTWIQPQLGTLQDALHDICALQGCAVQATQQGFRIE